MFNSFLSKNLSTLKDAGLFRSLKTAQLMPSAKIKIDGKSLINFSSNNYLDLARNQDITKAALEIIEKYGFGAASSRLVSGNFAVCKELESSIAKFKEKEAALVFPSGYQTNIGVISALISSNKESCIIMDKLNHASLWDGAKLAGSRIFLYEHCDMNSLEKVLKRACKYKVKLAVTESVFSMDGDFAPLEDFSKLCQKYGAISMVDEAHSTGVFGKEGKGLAQTLGVASKIDIIIGTLSKAFATQGGFVCGSCQLIDFLINKSRAFIYTTAVSPAICAAAIKSLEIVRRSDDKRQHLHNISKMLKDRLSDLGFHVANTQSQIIPVIVGSIENTEKLSLRLLEKGTYIPAIKPPTVPKGKARIRISLTSGNTTSDIEKLCAALNS
jgi:8-amino-7-oxononanoate synthase